MSAPTIPGVSDDQLESFTRAYVYACTWSDLRRDACGECDRHLTLYNALEDTWRGHSEDCPRAGMEPDAETGSDPYAYGLDDLTEDAAEVVRADCTAFVAANAADLLEYVASDEVREHVARVQEGDEWAQAGHDFYLTRAGSGVSFVDRFSYHDAPAYANRLRNNASAIGEFHRGLYLMEDGRVDLG